MSLPKIDVTKPKYDQSTYFNRAKHFILVTNPLNVLASNAELENAAQILKKYKNSEPLPEVTSVDQLWKAKYLYDSAFHPDTGEKMTLIGRMSAQVPMNMTITGCMMTFYKSTPAVVFWQWVNQSFNAIVNYTNKSGGSTISNETLFYSYCAATGGAVLTALSLNRLFKNMHPLVGRLSPMISVWSANCINIPLMRFEELKTGITVRDENGNELGRSKKAAKNGIAAVVFSRICMATPGMLFTPILMNSLEKRNILRKFPWANAPIQTLFCGLCLTFATPLCCALFSQTASIKVNDLEDELKIKIKTQNDEIAFVYYNKGL